VLVGHWTRMLLSWALATSATRGMQNTAAINPLVMTFIA